MNTNYESDPLAAELEAMTPTEISPELRNRIAGALGGEGGVVRPPAAQWRRGALFFLTAAAACVIVALWSWHTLWHLPSVNPEKAPQLVRAPLPTPSAPPATSLAAYRQALAQSPEALEALLDSQSTGSAAAETPVPIRAFARVDRDWIP
jgi:hypothetical protein